MDFEISGSNQQHKLRLLGTARWYTVTEAPTNTATFIVPESSYLPAVQLHGNQPGSTCFYYPVSQAGGRRHWYFKDWLEAYSDNENTTAKTEMGISSWTILLWWTGLRCCLLPMICWAGEKVRSDERYDRTLDWFLGNVREILIMEMEQVWLPTLGSVWCDFQRRTSLL